MEIKINEQKKIPFEKVGHGDLFMTENDKLCLKTEEIIATAYDGLTRSVINAIHIRSGKGTVIGSERCVTPVKSITVEI